MVETPAAALLDDQLAADVDFFSIGSNDLVQYVFAADREQPGLSSYLDHFHPAILRIIHLTVAGAARHGRPVSVCGGMASERLAIPLLIGLGIAELSVSVPGIAEIKATIRRLNAGECRAVAEAALNARTGAEVRGIAAECLNRAEPNRLSTNFVREIKQEKQLNKDEFVR
jgi:phosphoenolpyruvate-protein kinase (PTS system EI component)